MKRYVLIAVSLAALFFAVGLSVHELVSAPTDFELICEATAYDSPPAADFSPLSNCAEVQCGVCPGPECNVDGVCCGNSQVAECACTLDDLAVCSCR
jgi:hypothetical protein